MNIKELRESLGLSQQQLHEKTGIAREKIAKWEVGKGNPKVGDHLILSKFFGEQVPGFYAADPLPGFEKILTGEKDNTELVHNDDGAPHKREGYNQLLKNNCVLADANKMLAEANLILARSHDEIVQLAKDALAISLQRHVQDVKSVTHQNESKKHLQTVLKRKNVRGLSKDQNKEKQQSN